MTQWLSVHCFFDHHSETISLSYKTITDHLFINYKLEVSHKAVLCTVLNNKALIPIGYMYVVTQQLYVQYLIIRL